MQIYGHCWFILLIEMMQNIVNIVSPTQKFNAPNEKFLIWI